MSGCGRPTPQLSDPALSRETLQQALEAWKKGDTLDGYKQAVPKVTVVDRQWQEGVKLLGYEIDGDGQPDGYDMQFKVKLSVQESDGKQTKTKGTYNVSTSPALVIVRSDPGG